MRKFCVVVSAVLLISSFAIGQTNQSSPPTKPTPVTYQSATIVKLIARARTRTQEVRHTNMLDGTIVNQEIVTYEYRIRSGEILYTSRYTPDDQPGEMPDAWWVGNAPAQIRTKDRKLFIKMPKGGEIASRIVDQKPVAK